MSATRRGHSEGSPLFTTSRDQSYYAESCKGLPLSSCNFEYQPFFRSLISAFQHRIFSASDFPDPSVTFHLLEASMLLKIDDFLEPWVAGADELSHTLADSARSTVVDRRYEVLGQTELWHSFNFDEIHRVPKLSRYLETEFTCQWQAWIPDMARVIYSERMLESLFFSTLITRVNIALQNAIPSGDCHVTIIACPGAFDSHNPDMKGGKNTVILPDWVALECDYKPEDGNFPDLEQLALCGKIVAVGDTKLVSLKSDSLDIIDGTHSCHRNYLAQVQHYAKMLRTRYGFVVTNKELVLAQFLREEDSAPRPHDQRGLRSSKTVTLSLNSGLDSDFQSSDLSTSTKPVANVPHPSVTTQSKRRHESSDDLTTRRFPAAVDDQEDTYIDGLPSSPPTFSRTIDGIHSSPLGRHRAMGQLVVPRKAGRDAPPPPSPSDTGTKQTGLVSDLMSSPQFLSSELEFPHSSDTPYMSSERDYDVGKVLVRSFRIPNQYDKDPEQEANGLHPAKALFVMLMQASFIGGPGRRINIDEISFSGLRSESEL